MKGVYQVVLILILVQGLLSSRKSHVLELTDGSFEQYTQASTGFTTGNWFIMFHAPWCGYCQTFKPTWEELGEELHRNINIASVDATVETETAKRFEIKGYPTLLLLADKKLYKFQGERDLETLKSFALGDYKEEKGQEIPPPRSLWDKLEEVIAETSKNVNWGMVERDYEEVKDVNESSIYFMVGIGVFLGFVMAFLVK